MATPRLCSIPGCGKIGKLRRGWCHPHYMRWRSHGDPLGGGTANGVPMRYFREVVLAYEGGECLKWPFSGNQYGYGTVQCNGRKHLVSRLVCEEEHGPPPTPNHEAAHSCGNGNGGCCTKGHLSWKTPAENNADKIVHGTHSRGEKQRNHKLTSKDVLKIRTLIGKVSQKKIAQKFGVDPSAISRIHHGVDWGWLKDS